MEEKMSSITAACACIEANDPPIEGVLVCCEMTDDDNEPTVSLEVLVKYQGASTSHDRDHYQDYTFDDVDAWRRLGKAIQGIHLERFWFSEHLSFNGPDLSDVTSPPAACECVNALFDQLKYARSINEFEIELFPSDQVQMFDMRQLVQSNAGLQRLGIKSDKIMTMDQVDVLHQAIAASRLKHLSIVGCKLANDGSLEKILSACINVKEMWVPCHSISQYSALSMLFRNSTAILQHVMLFGAYNHDEMNQIMCQVPSSLMGNTTLKRLEFGSRHISDDDHIFCKLLCDTTSIRSIYDSNHTLEKITGAREIDDEDLEFIKYLELNENEDKTQVVRNKILKYYFIGDFDISPFINIPVSGLPEIISQIRSDTTQSAIFRLLKCIPELCNVASRCHTSEQSSKRPKIDE
jgi:hypothetical protein